MRTLKYASLIAATVITAVVAVAAAPAHASPAGTVPGIPANVHFSGQSWRVHAITLPAHPRTHLPQLRNTRHGPSGMVLAQSRNWSGYADAACSTCKFRYIETQFSVPRINCTGVTTIGAVWDSNWAGLDGLFDATVEQTGVDAYCNLSTPVYFGWYEMYPLAPVVFGITGLGAGSAIDANVYFDYGAGHYNITLTDYTQGVTMSTTQLCPLGSSCGNTSAEVIGEAPFVTPPGAFAPLANFGRVFFTGARVTSRNVTRGTLGDGPLWTSYQITMMNGPDVLAVPGPLTTGVSGGIPVSDFTDAWQASL